MISRKTCSVCFILCTCIHGTIRHCALSLLQKKNECIKYMAKQWLTRKKVSHFFSFSRSNMFIGYRCSKFMPRISIFLRKSIAIGSFARNSRSFVADAYNTCDVEYAKIFCIGSSNIFLQFFDS